MKNFTEKFDRLYIELRKAKYRSFSLRYTKVDAFVGDVRAAGVDMLEVKTRLRDV